MQSIQSAPFSGPRLTSTWRVDDVLRWYPVTGSVFSAFGVDVLSRGSQTLRAIALEAHVSPGNLIEALDARVALAADALRYAKAHRVG